MPNEIIRRIPIVTKHLGRDLAFLLAIGLPAMAGLVFTKNGLWVIAGLAILVGAWVCKKVFGWLD